MSKDTKPLEDSGSVATHCSSGFLGEKKVWDYFDLGIAAIKADGILRKSHGD